MALVAALVWPATLAVGATWETRSVTNERIGFSPETGVGPPYVVGWVASVGANLAWNPLVAGGVVITAGATNTTWGVKAVDAATGSVLWSYATSDDCELTGAVRGADIVFGCDDFLVRSLSIGSGALNWSYAATLLHVASDALVDIASDRVYLSAQPGMSGTASQLNCLDGATGSLIWSYQTNSGSVTSHCLVGTTLYAGFQDGVLRAFDAANGNVLWTYTVSPWGWIRSRISSNGTNVFFAAAQRAYCVNASGSGLVWSYDAVQTFDLCGAALGYGNAYIGTAHPTAGKLLCLDQATGAFVWSYGTGGAIQGTPCLVDGTCYFGSNDGVLRAVDVNSGSVQWSWTTGPIWAGSPSFSNGVLYVGTMEQNPWDGKLWAFAKTPLVTYTASPTRTPSGTGTATATVTPTATATESGSPTQTSTHSASATDTVTATATATFGPGPLLSQNLLRPDHGETVEVRYRRTSGVREQVAVYDGAGELVRKLVEGRASETGWSRVMWDGRTARREFVASGIYVVAVRTGQEIRHGKLAVVR